MPPVAVPQRRFACMLLNLSHFDERQRHRKCGRSQSRLRDSPVMRGTQALKVRRVSEGTNETCHFGGRGRSIVCLSGIRSDAVLFDGAAQPGNH